MVHTRSSWSDRYCTLCDQNSDAQQPIYTYDRKGTSAPPNFLSPIISGLFALYTLLPLLPHIVPISFPPLFPIFLLLLLLRHAKTGPSQDSWRRAQEFLPEDVHSNFLMRLGKKASHGQQLRPSLRDQKSYLDFGSLSSLGVGWKNLSSVPGCMRPFWQVTATCNLPYWLSHSEAVIIPDHH